MLNEYRIFLNELHKSWKKLISYQAFSNRYKKTKSFKEVLSYYKKPRSRIEKWRKHILTDWEIKRAYYLRQHWYTLEEIWNMYWVSYGYFRYHFKRLWLN